MRKFLTIGKFSMIGLCSLAFTTTALADEPIKVTGCVAAGVEAGCLVLRTITSKTYNISAAKPTPTPGSYGEVAGTLKSGAITTCMQGEVIDPAVWTLKGKSCPKEFAPK
jgi:hypothetical protein